MTITKLHRILSEAINKYGENFIVFQFIDVARDDINFFMYDQRTETVRKEFTLGDLNSLNLKVTDHFENYHLTYGDAVRMISKDKNLTGWKIRIRYEDSEKEYKELRRVHKDKIKSIIQLRPLYQTYLSTCNLHNFICHE